MSTSSLYPSDQRSDAEVRASRKKLDDELDAIWKRDRLAEEERERVEAEARRKANADEQEAQRLALAEAKTKAISALVADPAAMARRLLALEAEVAAMKAGVGALEDKRDRKPTTDHGK